MEVTLKTVVSGKIESIGRKSFFSPLEMAFFYSFRV
jgi:hypothetical protein